MNGWAQILNVKSFRQKLLVSSILCLIVPMVIAVLISNYITKDVLKEQAVANTEQTLYTLDIYVTNLINNLIYTTNVIQFDNEVTTILNDTMTEKGSTARFFQIKRMNEKFANVETAASNPIYLAVIDTSGTAYSNYSEFQDYDPLNFTRLDWFRQLENRDALETYWVGTQPNYIVSSASKSPYLITIARTIRNSSRTSGYIIASMFETDIHHIFQNYSSSQEIMLVNSKGAVLSHTNPSRIGTTFPYMNQIGDEGEGPVLVKEQNKDFLLVRHKLSFSDWYLVSMVPYKEAIDTISRVHQNVLLLTITCFAVFLIILLYLMNQLTKPIKLLGKVAAKVRSGNLTVRSNISTQDEIGEFAQSFDHMLDRIQLMIGQITLEQTRKRTAELEMLQAQVNPHILFNTINSVRMKIWMKGDRENAELLSSLSSFMRMTINRNNEYISLHDELELISNYVLLVNFRHKEPIVLELSPASDTLLEEIPRFSIQPFVENAILHGLKHKGGTVRVTSWKDSKGLAITVEDNGDGMGRDVLDRLRKKLFSGLAAEESGPGHTDISGIGLKNAYERLQLIYGCNSTLAIESEEGIGTKISIYIPGSHRREGKSNV
ncbi:histidine kinase [Paenibacillus sp. WQ 127069]|uniref:histidine kinase n=1 Tax=Paenibacillus baimaensis TaxID=2982185 RepID=A0ABT2UBT3_9BACL|nr:sensor histidine kinase [Paenibacillus sp. WQ 127069]MCU6792090.1 histidine kinase [Paenibacillus sp. WQ 127069]